MKDAYVDVFRNLIKETQESIGLELPLALEAYTAILLAEFLDKPDFLPERKTIGEVYFQLHTSRNAKELGDVCLFVTGVYPAIGTSKYTVNRKYYSDIGISSYEKAAQNLNYEIFELLSHNFIFLQRVIELTVSSKKAQSFGILDI